MIREPLAHDDLLVFRYYANMLAFRRVPANTRPLGRPCAGAAADEALNDRQALDCILPTGGNPLPDPNGTRIFIEIEKPDPHFALHYFCGFFTPLLLAAILFKHRGRFLPAWMLSQQTSWLRSFDAREDSDTRE